jgi:hypothetical protein
VELVEIGLMGPLELQEVQTLALEVMVLVMLEEPVIINKVVTVVQVL